MNAPLSVGIDVGGTHVRAAAVDALGNTRDFTHQIAPHANTDELVAQLCHRIQTFPQHLPVGIAIAGLVDATGQLLASPNLPNITCPLPLADIVADTCQRRVIVGNDASFAAVAEHRFGAAKDVASLLMVTIGTGVGAGIVLDDRLYTGHHGFAGEFGQMRLDMRMGGGFGGETIERYLSAPSIAMRANHNRDGHRLHTQDVVALATAGDEACRELLNDVGAVLGTALANVVNLLDMAVCVIGGGAGVGLYPAIYQRCQDTLAANLLGGADVRKVPPVRVAALGDSAGVIGAAVMAAN